MFTILKAFMSYMNNCTCLWAPCSYFNKIKMALVGGSEFWTFLIEVISLTKGVVNYVNIRFHFFLAYFAKTFRPADFTLSSIPRNWNFFSLTVGCILSKAIWTKIFFVLRLLCCGNVSSLYFEGLLCCQQFSLELFPDVFTAIYEVHNTTNSRLFLLVHQSDSLS